MPYKTILVYLNAEREAKSLSSYAMALAEAHGAHVIGLTVMPSFSDVPPAVTGTMTLIDDLRNAFRADAARLQAIFEAKRSAPGVTAEWRVGDPGFHDVMETVAETGQAADVIIACQDDPDWRNDGFRDMAGLLAIQAARPVLLLPYQGHPAGEPQRIVVAWDGSKEAARALFGALPLLKRAKIVTLVTVRASEERDGAAAAQARQQDADIGAALGRHGVTWVLSPEVPSEDGIGPTLLAAAERHSADMLVLGGYGHSRIGEFIFGGVTRHVLKHMTMPVLISH
jgi:nucleotide-binding universal stress UspA family protein